MIKQNEIKSQIKLCQKIKENGDFYDEIDKWALFGYLHALLYVDGKLNPKYSEISK